MNANGAPLIVDGRIYKTWNLLGHEFISPLSEYGEDLKVIGNVSTDSNGYIEDEKFDFTPEIRGATFISPHPITAARNMLNQVAIMRGDDAGKDFLVKFKYEDNYFE